MIVNWLFLLPIIVSADQLQKWKPNVDDYIFESAFIHTDIDFSSYIWLDGLFQNHENLTASKWARNKCYDDSNAGEFKIKCIQRLILYHCHCWCHCPIQITKFMGPTWGPPGSSRPQLGPMSIAIRVVPCYDHSHYSPGEARVPGDAIYGSVFFKWAVFDINEL